MEYLENLHNTFRDMQVDLFVILFSSLLPTPMRKSFYLYKNKSKSCMGHNEGIET